MLDIIICEDNEHFKLKTYNLVEKYFKKTNIKYNIMTFNKYSDKLKNYIKDNKEVNKIYILDICLDDDGSGIDIANDIRALEFNSIIILITGRVGLIPEAQKLRLNIFDYVCKQINFDKNITDLMEASVNVFNLRNSLKFTFNRNDYNIRLNDVLYIKTDKSIRKTIVATTSSEYDVSKPLCFFEDQVDKSFIKTNRGCLVNTSNIKMIDYESGTILFQNGKKIIGAISSKNISEVKECVRSGK